MADMLLDEVDADVRAERLHGLWMQYRKTLAVAVAALILGTAGNALWSHYQQKRGSELMMQFRAAQQLLSQKKYDEAASSFAVLARGTDGELNNLAQIWQARALVAAGKKPEAIEVLRGASNHGSALWGDIACLRLASLDAKAATCLDEKKATPLAWQRAQWAAANAWAAGDLAKATTILERLAADPELPPDAQAQMQQWLATVRAQATPATDKAEK